MQGPSFPRSCEYRMAARLALKGNWLRMFGLLLLADLASLLLPAIVMLLCIHSLSFRLPLMMRYPTDSSLWTQWNIAMYAASIPSLLLTPGILLLLVRPHQRQKARVADLFVGFRRPLHTLGTQLLYWLRAMLIFVLCLLPTFVMGIAGAVYRVSLEALYPLAMLLALAGFLVAVSQLLYFAAVPLLLAIRPELSARETLARSKALMTGRRWALVRLILSFIGWLLLLYLGALLIRIGLSFAAPSVYAYAAVGLLLALCLVFLEIYLSAAIAGFLLHADGMDLFGDGADTSGSSPYEG